MSVQTQLTLADESYEYRQFVEKFKPKKTTDDCYTPPEIYDVVLDWASNRYGFSKECVVRPFWPDADFERQEYPVGCVVLDNPPFSILSRICGFYLTHGIKFFLFAPTMTLLHAAGISRMLDCNHLAVGSSITYENGAKVNTSFVTNLDEDGTVLESVPELADLIDDKDKELQKQLKRSLPKYEYPDNIITAAKVSWYAKHHTPYKVNRRDCIPISKLDAMGDKTIFGGGLLLAERAAAERAAARKWQLSPRELAMIDYISKEREQ